MFSQGRSGGVGAGLLDLSIRGSEKKSVVSGILVFADSAIVKFRLPAKEFDALASSVSERTFSSEAMEAAQEMFGLLQRMRADGPRVLPEMLAEIARSKDRVHELLVETDSGESFAARDAARQELVSAEHSLQRERFLLTALLYDLKVDPITFFEDRGGTEEMRSLVASSSAPPEETPGMRVAGTPGVPADAEGQFFKTRKGRIVILVVVAVLILYGGRCTPEVRPRAAQAAALSSRSLSPWRLVPRDLRSRHRGGHACRGTG